MIDVDFIEIGTSDFNTLIEKASDSTVGFSIEALDFYLDRLPDKPNVEKVNIAVSPTPEPGMVDLYYVPIEIIEEKGLPYWVKGCSSIGHIHPDASIHGTTEYYQIRKLKCIPLTDFIEEKQIRKIKHLKIDVEGIDCDILDYYYDWLNNKNQDYHPNKITFEYKHSTPEQVSNICKKYSMLGYSHTKKRVDVELTK